jgi:hypothetical protein
MATVLRMIGSCCQKRTFTVAELSDRLWSTEASSHPC